MKTTEFQTLMETRRSIYGLNRELPVSKEAVIEMVEHAVMHSPSAFNSQSARVLVLFGEAHERLWDAAGDILKEIVGEANFAGTKAKMDSFKAGAGTVLFFEDQEVVEGLQANFPLYAGNFPVWSEHSSAINQYAIWLALTSANIGANLQHYNPLIDQFVAETWDIPANWKLRAQLVFGGIATPAGDKEFAPLASRLRVAE